MQDPVMDADPRDLPTIPYDLDDDLLQGVRDHATPRVRVAPVGAVAVIIGRGGKQADELHRQAIARDGVPLYRRPGGGCAVVLDPGNLTVALGLPLPGVGGITSAFATISTWLCDGLAACGFPGARQQGISDLVLDGRKIGGSCIYRTRGLLYYASTLLVDPHLDLVERYLPHPPREPVYRDGRPHRQFMGSLKDAATTPAPAEIAPRLEAVLAPGLPDLIGDTF